MDRTLMAKLVEWKNSPRRKPLIILDEIQECPKALTSLKYFCEDAPGYAIATWRSTQLSPEP